MTHIKNDPDTRLRGKNVYDIDAAGLTAEANGANGAGVFPTEPDFTLADDYEISPAPRFPLTVFGSSWGEWIRDHAEAKGCPVDYVAGGLLVATGSLIGNARRGSPWDGWNEPPILWIGLVGNPSSGKSPGLDVARDVIASIEMDANTNYQDELRAWNTKREEGEIRIEVWRSECKGALKDKLPSMLPPKPKEAEEEPRPTRSRIVTSDVTVEKLARLVYENPKGMVVHRDELAGWMGALDKYGGSGGDRATYLEAYGGRPYPVDRASSKTEDILIPAFCVSLVGGIQPDRLASKVLSGDDDGLAARFIYIWPERVRPVRPTRVPPSGAKAKLSKLYRLAHDEDGNSIVVPFDDAAASLLDTYRQQVADIEAEASGLLMSWLGKLPGMAVRLALIFEHLWWCGDHEYDDQCPQAISEKAVIAAIVFLDEYAMPMAQRCFGESSLPRPERDVRAIARWMLDNGPEIINPRHLRQIRVISGSAPASRYDEAISKLEEAGWLRPSFSREGGSSGRQSKDWLVNPKVMEG